MNGDAFPELQEVALVGAVASVEEALQMNQMRFILMWANRVQTLPKEAPGPASLFQGAASLSALPM